MKANAKTKYLFVTGGVFSSLGKGLCAASIGALLTHLGLKVACLKIDPYLNIDCGTMSPYQHGEVFVTSDGTETDLDLGHYERFLGAELTSDSSITSGKIYNRVISAERKGKYLGKTIQVIPHVTDEIKNTLYELGHKTDADIIIVEVGGTIGDIESLPFMEAIRQMRSELNGRSLLLHMVPLIELKISGEKKTKPLQQSIKELNSLGLNADLLFVRSSEVLDPKTRAKIMSTCYISNENIFSGPDLKNIYLLPQRLYHQKLHEQIAKKLDLKFKTKKPKQRWTNFVRLVNKAHDQRVKIAIVGKYTELIDAYISLYESLKITAIHEQVDLDLVWVNSSKEKQEDILRKISKVDGIIVPGGFDKRGINGKLTAIKYAREKQVPFLGICLGMQLACIEFARNVIGLKDADSTEFNKKTKNNVIDLIVKDRNVDMGGTLRLGSYQCSLKPQTLAQSLYQANSVRRRHRHRYEFNNDYKELFEKHNFVFSGSDAQTGLQEIIELPNHPYFIAAQYHPEFNTTLYKPEELFSGLVRAIKSLKAK